MINKTYGRRRPPLSITKILNWADDHFKRTSHWPTVETGKVLSAPGKSWRAISQALDHGYRDLPGGSSLAQLLAERRQVKNRMAQPPLTQRQILAWADAHHRATGRWPTNTSGRVRDAATENWGRIARALVRGDRGLPGGSSLAELLAKTRGVRNPRNLQQLQIPQILLWADRHYKRYRDWPNPRSGRVVGVIGEDWGRINTALKLGTRGLVGGSSLAKLLAAHRGVRTKRHLPLLDTRMILFWADAHCLRTGTWPTDSSGQVSGSPQETWKGVSQALRMGFRGLPGGSSLARLLEEHRGQVNFGNRLPLTLKQILAWADDHRARTGKWPTHTSGAVLSEPSETWAGIQGALVQRLRGIKHRSSLARLLGEKRGYLHRGNRPQLSVGQILRWANAHFDRTGNWPNRSSGAVAGTHGESWKQISQALHRGHRGLKGGSSLSQLLAKAVPATDIKSGSRRRSMP